MVPLTIKSVRLIAKADWCPALGITSRRMANDKFEQYHILHF